MSARHGIGALLVLAAIAARPGSAAAEPESRPPWQLGYAFAAGAAQIGDLGFARIGLQFHLGRQVTPELRISAAGELLNTNRGNGADLLVGETSRATIGAEWELGQFGRFGDLGFGGAVSLVGGGGGELIAWDRGTARRPMGYLGAECAVGFGIPRGRAIRGIRSLAYRIGLRAEMFGGISGKGPEAVGAASRPVELGFLGYMGLDFGR